MELKDKWGDQFVSVEHLVLALVDDPRFGASLFKNEGLTSKKLEEVRVLCVLLCCVYGCVWLIKHHSFLFSVFLRLQQCSCTIINALCLCCFHAIIILIQVYLCVCDCMHRPSKRSVATTRCWTKTLRANMRH